MVQAAPPLAACVWQAAHLLYRLHARAHMGTRDTALLHMDTTLEWKYVVLHLKLCHMAVGMSELYQVRVMSAVCLNDRKQTRKEEGQGQALPPRCTGSAGIQVKHSTSTTIPADGCCPWLGTRHPVLPAACQPSKAPPVLRRTRQARGRVATGAVPAWQAGAHTRRPRSGRVVQPQAYPECTSSTSCTSAWAALVALKAQRPWWWVPATLHWQRDREAGRQGGSHDSAPQHTG